MLATKGSTYNERPTFANPMYLKKAQSEKPCLYEIPYDKSDLANIFAPDREAILTLEQETRSKLNKDLVKPYDYTKQNSLYEIFKPPSRECLDQLEHANKIRKKMWRKSFVKFVTACIDSLKSRTSNVNVVCATCEKCVFNLNHVACVSIFLNDVNAKTKKPKIVPISTRKLKSQVNKSVATPPKKTIVSDFTIQKSKSYYSMLYEKTSKAWKWWIAQQCPSGYKWVPKTKMKWMSKVRKEDDPICQMFHRPLILLLIMQLVLFIVDSGCTKHMTRNLKLLCNFIEKYLGTVPFGNDQFAPILGYRDLVQGNITIKRVYYIEGLNHNLFSIGRFCDADLEVALWKSTCFVRDL
ncbi:hypothetical protein Tco_0015399 [Tanacetum coccineum]